MDSEGTTYRETIGEVTLGRNIAQSSEPRNRIICNFKCFGTTCVGELAKSNIVTGGCVVAAVAGPNWKKRNRLGGSIDLHGAVGISGVSHLVGTDIACRSPVDIGVVAVTAEGPDFLVHQ